MVVCQFYLTDVGDDDGGERDARHSVCFRFVFVCVLFVSVRALNSRGFAGRAGARPVRGTRLA